MGVYAFCRAGMSLAVAALLIIAPAGARSSDNSASSRDSAQACCSDGKPADVAPGMAAEMITWIVGKTGWTKRKLPHIKFLPHKQIVALFSENPGGADGIHIVAAYSDKRHIIYLSNQWDPGSLRDRAALLHELVHHLQDLNKVKVACPAQYEKQAYELTIAWLGDNGVKDPYEFLGIDERYIYLMSHCSEF